jgi:hypothetical protein
VTVVPIAQAKLGDVVEYDGKLWRVTFYERGARITRDSKPKHIPGHLGLTEIK